MLENSYGNKFIGAHVSAAGGVDQAPLRAKEIAQMRLPYLLKISVSGTPNRLMKKLSLHLNLTVSS